MAKKMHLAFDVSYIAMDGRWRMSGSWVGRTFPDVGMYEDIARIAERGLFDMVFSGDGTGIPARGVAREMRRSSGASVGRARK
jgi:alkanesulfonate monooxygenase SsuD/methylene tetrahydromethanopterin reductase-like flavin-dependent oxidoreductase (luciferase family)